MAEFLLLKKGRFLKFTLTLIASFFLITTGWGQTVKTDKDDYSPGQYVIVTGTEWEPGETVSFDFHETPKVCSSDHHIRSTIAKADGTILYDQFLINERHLGVSFELTATGQTSGMTAVTYFTDAGIRNVSVVGTSFCAGQSFDVTFDAVSANVGFGGGQFNNTNSFIAELSDPSGLFSSPIIIGQLNNSGGASNGRIIDVTIPVNTVYGTGYKIRVRSTSPVTNQPDNGINLTINAKSTDSNAGANQNGISGTSTTLAANAPTVGTGAWSILSGTGGSFGSTATSTSSNPTATFNGTAGSTYDLRWTITNGPCTSTDDVTISFSNIIATTTTLSSSSNPSAYKESVTFTATVAPSSGTNTPTGNVIFKNGIATIGNVALSTITGAQRATLTTTALPVNTSGHSITAVYEGAGNFETSTSSAISQIVNKAESTIVATGTTIFTYSGSAQGPSTSDVTGSTGAVTYSYSGNSNGSVAYGPSATKPTLAGSYSVIASVAADDNYNGKSSEALDFTIGKANQTIAVTTASPSSAVYNTGFTVAATASSGLPVSYSSSAPLSNVGADYTMNSGIGTGVVKYNQAGDDNYNAAREVTANVAAAKAESTIVATGTTTFTYSGSAQGPSTSIVTGSTGAVTYSYSGISNGGVAYVPLVTAPTLAGSYGVVATVATDDNYNGKSSEALDFTIGKANQTIAVTTASPSSAVYNTGFTVAATASSGLPVSYSSSAPLSNVGADYTMNSGIGTGVVKYNQAGDDNYNAAPEVTANVAAAKAESTIVATGTTTFTYSGSAQGPSSSDVTGSTGAVTYSYSGTSNGGVAYAASSTAPTLAGSYTVVATVAADDNYNGKSSDALDFTIGKAESTIVATGTTTFIYNGSAQGPSSSDVTGSTGAVTYSYSGTSNGGVAYAASSTAPTLAGSYTVVATVAADDNYNGKSSDALDFTIERISITITPDAQQFKFCGQADDDPFTYTPSSSLIAGNSFSGKLNREAGEGVGSYAYNIGSLNAGGNYSLTLIGNATYEIKGVVIDASASSTTVQLGATNGPLSATVIDGNGNFIYEASVTFIVSNNAGGILATLPGILTNSLGVASTTINVSALPIGVYTVKAVAGSGCADSYGYMTIYDPNSDFVTGGGWVNSPEGAYVADASLFGKANFGFVAKYKKGRAEVDGNTEFQFKAGNFNFKSNFHNSGSLVVSGAKATYRGEGTVNGSGNYGFMVSAYDGAINGSSGGSDKFRIKIWDISAGNAVVYDNKLGALDNADISGDLNLVLGGGSVVIHQSKANNKTAEVIEKIAVTASEEAIVEILESMAVAPNPVKDEARVRFSLIEDATVMLRVFDFNGREVDRLFSGSVRAHEVKEVGFQRRNLMSGVYILKLTTDRGNSYDKQIIVE